MKVSYISSHVVNILSIFILFDCNFHLINFFKRFLGIALSPNNHEVHVYNRSSGEWQLTDVLDQHDLRVTGIDWAPKTNRIVTCAAVSNSVII